MAGVVPDNMKTEEIEVYSSDTNACVIRMPERQFPGVLIQGDSLSIIYEGLMAALEGVEGQVDNETFLAILEQAQDIELHLLHYEATLATHGIEIPYVRNRNRTTMKYKHYWTEQ